MGFKKTKYGVEVDSDKDTSPRFGKRTLRPAVAAESSETKKKFGKKKIRKQAVAKILSKARKGR